MRWLGWLVLVVAGGVAAYGFTRPRRRELSLPFVDWVRRSLEG